MCIEEGPTFAAHTPTYLPTPRMQFNSSEIVSRGALRRLEKLHARMHPHLQHLLRPHSGGSRSLSVCSSRTHQDSPSPRAGGKDTFSNLREQLSHRNSKVGGNGGKRGVWRDAGLWRCVGRCGWVSAGALVGVGVSAGRGGVEWG